jgi:hypothetical protein
METEGEYKIPEWDIFSLKAWLVEVVTEIIGAVDKLQEQGVGCDLPGEIDFILRFKDFTGQSKEVALSIPLFRPPTGDMIARKDNSSVAYLGNIQVAGGGAGYNAPGAPVEQSA